ncbi:hypothetical protein HYALB_00000488, partial [Hymenoscyphus albidus]
CLHTPQPNTIGSHLLIRRTIQSPLVFTKSRRRSIEKKSLRTRSSLSPHICADGVSEILLPLLNIGGFKGEAQDAPSKINQTEKLRLLKSESVFLMGMGSCWMRRDGGMSSRSDEKGVMVLRHIYVKV